jgi:hypothetical protein
MVIKSRVAGIGDRSCIGGLLVAVIGAIPRGLLLLKYICSSRDPSSLQITDFSELLACRVWRSINLFSPRIVGWRNQLLLTVF